MNVNHFADRLAHNIHWSETQGTRAQTCGVSSDAKRALSGL
jgi:hypothetical protein